MERKLNKSQHTKLTLEKKILPPLLPGSELATFRPRVRRSNQQSIPSTDARKVQMMFLHEQRKRLGEVLIL